MRQTVTMLFAAAIAALVFIPNSALGQTPVATDDAESYSSGYTGTNGGSGWGSAFESKNFGSNDTGGTFLETGNRRINGAQSFAIFAEGGSAGTGAAVTRSVALTGSNTYRIDFLVRFDLDPNGGTAGFNLNSTATSAQTNWDDGQELFIGTVGNGTWAYDGGSGATTVIDGGGADYPLNGGDIYRVRVDITPSLGEVDLYIENTSSGTNSTINSFTLSSPGSDIQSIGFGNGVAAPFQNLIFDDIEIIEGPATPIPVELADFRTMPDGSAAVLTWRTLSETSNDRFEIEHAAPGQSFRLAGTVRGQGTTVEATDYRFRLDDLAPGTHRFRLRQVDVDGTASLSAPRSVTIGVQGLSLSKAAPHPVAGRSIIGVSVDRTSPIRVEMFNLLGQRVRTLFDGTVTTAQPMHVEIAADGLASGTYFIRATNGAASTVQRVTVVR